MAYSKGSMPKSDHVALIKTIRDIARAFKNPVFIEIGIWQGRTSRLILQILRDARVDAEYIGTDISKEAIVNGQKRTSAKIAPRVKRRFYLGGISKVPVEEAHWIFIDGCHCYQCVMSDIEVARKMVVHGGYLVFHDSDKRHEDDRADQRYHGKPWRKVEVARAIKDSNLEEDFNLEFEINGISRDPKFKKIRRLTHGGLAVYSKK